MSEVDEKNATQLGAEGSETVVEDQNPPTDEGGGEEERKPIDARLSAMDAIAQRLEKERAEAAEPVEGKTEIPVEEVDEKATSIEPKILDPDDFSKFKIKLKIDGKEEAVDLASLVKDGQKEKAADKKLMEASLALKAAEERLRLVEELEKKLKPDKSGDDPPDNKDGQEEEEDVTFDDFLDGNREKIEKFLKKVGAATKATPAAVEIPDAQEVARQVETALENKRTMTDFRKDYEDVMGDPLLADITHRFYQQVVADGETSYDAALRKAGESTRQWLKEKGIAPKSPAPDLATKAEKKKTIDNITPLNTRSPSTREQKAETVSDVIAAMRAGRPGSR